MGKKCCVINCTNGYESQKKEFPDRVYRLFRFPKDSEKQKQWLRVLPNKIDVLLNNHRVCSDHFVNVQWGKGANGSLVPLEPPNCFKGTPPSCSGTPNAYRKARSTIKSTADARAIDLNELPDFHELDSLKLFNFHTELESKVIDSGLGLLAWGCEEDSFRILSKTFTKATHDFIVFMELNEVTTDKVTKLNYVAYLGRKRFQHPIFPTTVTCWSQFDALLHSLTNQENSISEKKDDFVSRQIELLDATKNGKLYSVGDLLQGFKWFSMSRPLYSDLRKYLQLPSQSTLQSITRVAKKLDDTALFSAFFKNQEERSKGCMLIVDEVYVKASLTYRGGEVFGYAADRPEKEKKIANTLLCFMAKCFFTNHTFLVKMIPCHALNADFMYECLTNVTSQLEASGARVHGLICDNNRVNQRLFKSFFTPLHDKPYLVKSPSGSDRPFHLMYDPVHLLKNIRNNWHTEKTQTVKFFEEGHEQLAYWDDLKSLLRHEENFELKQSKLTKATVYPTSIEKQKVSLALNIFNDKTRTALTTTSVRHDHPTMASTSKFIAMVVQLWKLWNCKSIHEKVRNKDPDKIVINKGPEGEKAVQLLRKWAQYAVAMRQSTPARQRELTGDTAKALEFTCLSLIDISLYLLGTDSSDKHDYVCLGFFQQDDLEHHFAHFRMSSGCNIFMSVSEVFATHSIDKAKMMLEHCADVDVSQSKHSCKLCTTDLTDDELLLLDEMPSIDDISQDVKLSLFYIAGYVAAKHPELSGTETDYVNDSAKDYLQSLDRGSLTYPSLSLYKLVLLAYIFFSNTPQRLCRRRFVKILMTFPGLFHLDFYPDNDRQPLARISNIFLKRFAEFNNRNSFGNDRPAIVKLTSGSTRRM